MSDATEPKKEYGTLRIYMKSGNVILGNRVTNVEYEENSGRRKITIDQSGHDLEGSIMIMVPSIDVMQIEGISLERRVGGAA